MESVLYYCGACEDEEWLIYAEPDTPDNRFVSCDGCGAVHMFCDVKGNSIEQAAKIAAKNSNSTGSIN